MPSKTAQSGNGANGKSTGVKRTRGGTRILGRSPITGHYVLESPNMAKASFTLDEALAAVRKIYAREER